MDWFVVDVVQPDICTGQQKLFLITRRTASTTLSFCTKDSFIQMSATPWWRRPMRCCAIWLTMILRTLFRSWNSLRHSAIVWWDGHPLQYEHYLCVISHHSKCLLLY